MHRVLEDMIKSKRARLCVVDLGYAGFPTATFFAESGFPVIGRDFKEDVVKLLKMGNSQLKVFGIDGGVNPVVKNGRRTASLHVADAVRTSDTMLIIVLTPTGLGSEPDFQYVISAGGSVNADSNWVGATSLALVLA